MLEKVSSAKDISIYTFSSIVRNTQGEAVKPVLNKASIDKKINNIEDAIYYLKVFSEVLQSLLKKQKENSYITISKYDALVVLKRDVEAAIINAYNNKEGNL